MPELASGPHLYIFYAYQLIMTTYLVHMHRHCGWYTATAEGATFAEAAVKAVIEMCLKYGLDVNTVPHTVEYIEYKGYPHVAFTETSRRQVWGRVTKPGDAWFWEQVREGQDEDCLKCGGTGINHYNPFMQCWGCGNHKEKGQGSGKKHLEAVT